MRPVGPSQDFVRIHALPRRTVTDVPDAFEDLLRAPGGTQRLRPVQKQALCEIATSGGAFCPIRVGAGKTLVSLLAPYVLQAERPVLLLPASLVEKTRREMRELSRHWRIPKNIRVISYEMLGRVQSANTLDLYRPDLIIADEAHRLKNKRAGVTRRVVRYMRANPQTRFVAMSGTIMRNSLKDFGHLLAWTHKQASPLPLEEHTLREWADCVDEKVNPLARLDAGVLLTLPGTGNARQRLQSRILETEGVIADLSEDVDCSLYVRSVTHSVSAQTEANFARLRTAWERPDGWTLSEASEVWNVARQIALGFHYFWQPWAPKEWLEARRAWASFARETLSVSRTLDTELQVVNAVDRGDLPEGREVLAEWRKIRPTFTVNPTLAWHDTSALDFCASWLEGGGIVWSDYTEFGRELSRRTGVEYFGAKGLSDKGLYVEDATGPIIVSRQANATGKNLQKRWRRNLVTSIPASGSDLEQLIGRTHRTGQEADSVEVDLLVTCWEHQDSWTKCLATARMSEELMGQKQKILYADVEVDTERHNGHRWHK